MVPPALILHNVESLERWLFLTLLSSCPLPSHLGSSSQGLLNYGQVRRCSRAGTNVVQLFCVGEPPKSYRTPVSASPQIWARNQVSLQREPRWSSSLDFLGKSQCHVLFYSDVNTRHWFSKHKIRWERAMLLSLYWIPQISWTVPNI